MSHGSAHHIVHHKKLKTFKVFIWLALELLSQITLLATIKEDIFFPMHAKQPIGGVELLLQAFLTLSLDGGKCSASRYHRFISRYWHPQHPINRRMWRHLVPSGSFTYKKKSLPCREPNNSSSVLLPQTSHYTDCTVPAAITVLVSRYKDAVRKHVSKTCVTA
jgi:hypothetical protein